MVSVTRNTSASTFSRRVLVHTLRITAPRPPHYSPTNRTRKFDTTMASANPYENVYDGSQIEQDIIDPDTRACTTVPPRTAHS